jgi:hypothetical protein
MVKNIVFSIFIINILIFLVLIINLRRWQKKKGNLSEKSVALILTGFFNFFSITTFIPLIRINFCATIIVILILLTLSWLFLYPSFRFLGRRYKIKK